MKTDPFYISSCTIIRDYTITRNGHVLYRQDAGNPVDFLNKAYDSLQVNYPRFYKMDVLGKLGIIGAHVLLGDETTGGTYTPYEKGMVLSNRNSSIEADVRYYESVHEIPSPSLFVYTLPNIVMGEIAIRHQFKGENAFFITETFDADLLCFYVQDLLRHNRLKACICGWVEAVDERADLCFFWVEKQPSKNAVPLSADQLNKIYLHHDE